MLPMLTITITKHHNIMVSSPRHYWDVASPHEIHILRRVEFPLILTFSKFQVQIILYLYIDLMDVFERPGLRLKGKSRLSSQI